MSPVRPNYLYLSNDAAREGLDAIEFDTTLKVLGVAWSASGLRLMEVDPDLRTVTVMDGQTEEVRCTQRRTAAALVLSCILWHGVVSRCVGPPAACGCRP